MGRVAWRKVMRDLWLTRGRVALLVTSIALSIVGLGAILSAYSILTREMPLSYLSSQPASATLVLDHSVDRALLAAVRQRPGVADAEARGFVRARAEIAPDQWRSLTLFIVDDFDAMRIETLRRREGAWPPGTGTMLVEGGSLAVLETHNGAVLTVQTPNGQPRSVPVVGVVEDLGAAPAWQEQSGYAYVTPETLAWLGEPASLDQLKIVVAERPLDVAAIQSVARDLSAWLNQQGWTVEEIRIPPPGEHPHQRLMNALALALLLFSLLALGLSAIVVTVLVGGMLARQTRQIGAMKAIGARPIQLASIYAATIMIVGSLATALSIPASLAAGRQLAGAFASLSNVALASSAVPWWVYLVELAAGLLVPLLAAIPPIIRASSITVREALREHGIAYEAGGQRSPLTARIDRLLGPTLTMAVHNTLRRRSGLALSLTLLVVGGATFMSGLNVADASDRRLAAGEASRAYDLDFVLSRPQPAERLLQIAQSVSGVAAAEADGFAQPTPLRDGEVPLGTTYKDGGHGSLIMRAVPPTTPFVQYRLLEGRWLQPGDTDAMVVVRGGLDRSRIVGDTVALAIEGRATRWRIVGVIDQPLALTSAYVSDLGFAEAIGQVGQANALRLATTSHAAEARASAGLAVRRALTEAGIGIMAEFDAERVNVILRNHLAIVQGALQLLGLMLGAVGAFTLASAMSTSVVERTREIGVLQTLGATPARVMGIVVAEGAFIGCLSWPMATALAGGLSFLLEGAIGTFLFQEPLPFSVSPAALLAWLAIVVFGSVVASAYPAWAASRLTIRDALAYL